MIRPAMLSDVTAIQRLNATTLGYDLDVAQTKQQLERLLKQEEHVILVAENAVNQVVGYAHAVRYDCLYFPSLLNLLALAVDAGFQGQGYGKELMNSLRKRGKAKGYLGIRINSGITRQDAHNFYRSLGCLEKADQKRFFLTF